MIIPHLGCHTSRASSRSMGIVGLPLRTGRSLQLLHLIHRLPPTLESAGQRCLAGAWLGPVLQQQKEKTKTSSCEALVFLGQQSCGALDTEAVNLAHELVRC